MRLRLIRQFLEVLIEKLGYLATFYVNHMSNLYVKLNQIYFINYLSGFVNFKLKNSIELTCIASIIQVRTFV